MVAGTISDVTRVFEGAEEVLIVGTYLYFLFEDNGEGSNAGIDRFSQNFYYSLASDPNSPYCGVLNPTGGAWPASWIIDVDQGGNIQIK